jgi:hypothetical protein
MAGAPMAGVPGGYPAPQPGYPQPQPGYAQPAGYPAGQPPQKESHFVRNCLVCSCLLVLALIVGTTALVVGFANALKTSFVQTPAEIAPIAQSVSPGVQTPRGYNEKFGVNLNFLGTKAQGVILEQPGGNGTTIAYGAMSEKPKTKDEFKKQVKTALQNKPDGSQGDLPAESEETPAQQQTEEEFTLGNGEKVKFLRAIVQDQNRPGKKGVTYVGILDPYPNSFGWLGVFATGPEETFDKAGFEEFLSTLKKK